MAKGHGSQSVSYNLLTDVAQDELRDQVGMLGSVKKGEISSPVVSNEHKRISWSHS